MFWKREEEEKAFLENLRRFEQEIENAVALLRDLVKEYSPDSPKVGEYAVEIDKTESRADTIRREMLRTLVMGFFLVDLKEDLTNLIEMLDKVANKAEVLSDRLAVEKPNLPDFVKEALYGMAEKNVEAVKTLREAFDKLFVSFEEAFDICRKVEALEKEVDRIEDETLKRIFAMDADLCTKFYLRGFVSDMAQISDMVEDISDEIELVAIKRKV